MWLSHQDVYLSNVGIPRRDRLRCETDPTQRKMLILMDKRWKESLLQSAMVKPTG